jgi:hypothetical protein
MGSFGDSGRLRTDEITPETPDALIMWGNFVCPESQVGIAARSLRKNGDEKRGQTGLQ